MKFDEGTGFQCTVSLSQRIEEGSEGQWLIKEGLTRIDEKKITSRATLILENSVVGLFALNFSNASPILRFRHLEFWRRRPTTTWLQSDKMAIKHNQQIAHNRTSSLQIN